MAEADCLYFFKAALAEPSHVCAWRPKQKLATRTRWVDSEYFNKCHETFALTLDWLRLLQLEKVILATQGCNHGKNLGSTSAMVGRICPPWLG